MTDNVQNTLFTKEEMKEFKITSWKYEDIREKPSVSLKEDFSIWDYKLNHLRFRECLDNPGLIFEPFIPLFLVID